MSINILRRGGERPATLDFVNAVRLVAGRAGERYRYNNVGDNRPAEANLVDLAIPREFFVLA